MIDEAIQVRSPNLRFCLTPHPDLTLDPCYDILQRELEPVFL
jgi:hypothetical protein